MGLTCRTVTPCKEIQDSLGFWIALRGFRIDSTICPWNLYILDSNLKKDFGFLEWYSVFQSPVFRIPQENCSLFSDSKIKRARTSRIPEFGWGENSLLAFCESVLFTWDEKNCDVEPKLKVMNESFKPDLSLTFFFSRKIPGLPQIPNAACHKHQHKKTSRNIHDDASYVSMV